MSGKEESRTMAKASGNGKGGRRAKRTESLKGTPEKREQMEITIAPDHSSAFPTFYANYASVSHTASEFDLDFCLLASPFTVDLEQKSISLPVVARIIIPPVMIGGLIDALKAQMEKQQETAQIGKFIVPVPVPVPTKGGKS